MQIQRPSLSAPDSWDQAHEPRQSNVSTKYPANTYRHAHGSAIKCLHFTPCGRIVQSSASAPLFVVAHRRLNTCAQHAMVHHNTMSKEHKNSVVVSKLGWSFLASLADMRKCGDDSRPTSTQKLLELRLFLVGLDKDAGCWHLLQRVKYPNSTHRCVVKLPPQHHAELRSPQVFM